MGLAGFRANSSRTKLLGCQGFDGPCWDEAGGFSSLAGPSCPGNLSLAL